MKPEARIRIDIRKFMESVGFAMWDTEQGYRQDRGGTRVTPGFPDLVAIGHDMVVFIEVKSPKGRLSLAQLAFQAECKANGVRAEVWRDPRDAFDWCVEQGIVREVK